MLQIQRCFLTYDAGWFVDNHFVDIHFVDIHFVDTISSNPHRRRNGYQRNGHIDETSMSTKWTSTKWHWWNGYRRNRYRWKDPASTLTGQQFYEMAKTMIHIKAVWHTGQNILYVRRLWVCMLCLIVRGGRVRFPSFRLTVWSYFGISSCFILGGVAPLYSEQVSGVHSTLFD